jgi:adenine-specific DNA-methyltransferase
MGDEKMGEDNFIRKIKNNSQSGCMDVFNDCVSLLPCGSYYQPPDTKESVISPRSYPQVIKYMGSKAALLPFIAKSITQIHAADRPIVDLFAGACAISGGFGHVGKIVSNDIQKYSATIASSYLHRAEKAHEVDIFSLIEALAQEKLRYLPDGLSHSENCTLEEFNVVEDANKALLNLELNFPYNLFTRAYSGTWWSAEQCVWIDSIRQALDILKDNGSYTEADFQIGLTCLMHAMAYTSQGTGHYAQYRDAKTEASMRDIAKYRRQSVFHYFSRKFLALLAWNKRHVIDMGHQRTSLDYQACLGDLPRSLIYADPPYAFVHYSRFYHAIETVALYDYPALQMKGGEVVKGRYRSERHQSPFCIGSQVYTAFQGLFDGVKNTKSDLLLSYSNTGVIGINELIDLAHQELGSRYSITVKSHDHDHMTMGRRDDRTRQVKESLIVARHI